MIGTDKEASLVVGSLTAIMAAVLTFAQEFGVNLTDGQQSAITNLVAVLAPIIAALVIRGLVFSKNSTQLKINEGFADGQQGATEPPKVA